MRRAGLATCRECGYEFWLSTSGGFAARIVFCEDCGHGESGIHGHAPLNDGDSSLPQPFGSVCLGGLQ